MTTATIKAAPKQRITGPNGEFRLDQQTVINILNNKRTTITPKEIGKLIRAYVQGTPQFFAKGSLYTTNGVERENALDRMIYNLTLTDAAKMTKKENRQLFTDAVKAESAGEIEKAHELYNEFLNAVQMTFSVIDNASTRRFTRGEYVQGVVGTAVNGITGDVALILDNVVAVAAEQVAATKFSVSDFLLAD